MVSYFIIIVLLTCVFMFISLLFQFKAKTNKDGKLESCKPIHKVEIKTNRMG